MRILKSTLLLFLMTLTFVSCNKEVSMTEFVDPVHYGKIVVKSDPPGAQIILNGDNTGKFTPDSLLYMEAGAYEVKLSMRLFIDTLFNINLAEHDTSSIYINYMNSPRNFGNIRCISHPENSLIFLDDSCTGLYTPDTLNFIWPGEHKLKYTHPEHRADSTTITVFAGRDNNALLFLQDTSKVINYTPDNSVIPTASINSVAVDNNGVVWCGSFIGLIKFDEPNWTLYNSINSELPTTNINTVMVDNQNRVWVGTPACLVIIDGDD